MTTYPSLNKISGIDFPFPSLNGATATGAGDVKQFPMPVNVISCQVSYDGGPSAVKVTLEGTIDGTNWFVLSTFDTGASGTSGNIITSSTIVINTARANLQTLTGGTDPTVSAFILANRGG